MRTPITFFFAVLASASLCGCPVGPSRQCGHSLTFQLTFEDDYPQAGMEFELLDGTHDGEVRDCIPGTADDFEHACVDYLFDPGLIFTYSDEFGETTPESAVLIARSRSDPTQVVEFSVEPTFELTSDGFDPICESATESIHVEFD